MLEAVISLFNEHVPGVGYVESSSDTRKTLAKESQSFCCEKCGPIKNILKVRKALQIVQPQLTVLPKPMPFASHDSRKLSEVMLFTQEGEPNLKPDPTITENCMTEVQPTESAATTTQKRPTGSKSIFAAGTSCLIQSRTICDCCSGSTSRPNLRSATSDTYYRL